MKSSYHPNIHTTAPSDYSKSKRTLNATNIDLQEMYLHLTVRPVGARTPTPVMDLA